VQGFIVKNSDANALLLVLSMIFVLTTASYQIWQVLSLRVDVERQREIYYRRFYLTDSILNDATAIAAKNFDQIFTSKVAIKFNFAERVKESGYVAYAWASAVFEKGKPKPDLLAVGAYLIKADQCAFSIKCLLTRLCSKTQTGFTVSNYSIE
jgi:hypothetical protein